MPWFSSLIRLSRLKQIKKTLQLNAWEKVSCKSCAPPTTWVTNLRPRVQPAQTKRPPRTTWNQRRYKWSYPLRLRTTRARPPRKKRRTNHHLNWWPYLHRIHPRRYHQWESRIRSRCVDSRLSRRLRCQWKGWRRRGRSRIWNRQRRKRRRKYRRKRLNPRSQLWLHLIKGLRSLMILWHTRKREKGMWSPVTFGLRLTGAITCWSNTDKSRKWQCKWLKHKNVTTFK